MTEQKPAATGPARRWRMVRALGRALLNVLLLIVLYYLLPLDRALDAGAITVLVFGLLVVVGLIGWQIRAILRADYPALRAVEGLATTIPLFLLLFAVVYFVMARAQPAAFTQLLSRTDALYFTVWCWPSVGRCRATATTAPPPGNHATGAATVTADGGYRGTGLLIAHRRQLGQAALPAGQEEEHHACHRRVRARVEHVLARRKAWKILRDGRRRGAGVHLAALGIAYLPNLAWAG